MLSNSLPDKMRFRRSDDITQRDDHVTEVSISMFELGMTSSRRVRWSFGKSTLKKNEKFMTTTSRTSSLSHLPQGKMLSQAEVANVRR